jgi:thermostable 8-oxoguanine DNA glycosylase
MEDIELNPNDLPRYNRPKKKQEAFLMFCVLAAGKNSMVQAEKLQTFLTTGQGQLTPRMATGPFHWAYMLWEAGCLEDACRQHKLGKYNLIVPCFRELGRRTYDSSLDEAEIDPRDTSVSQLQQLKGIGKKTSRFFLLHTDPEAQVAALDTHILAWLGDQGYEVPNKTPRTENRYQELEAVFLMEASARDITPAQLDIRIWKNNSLQTTFA